MKEKLVSLSLLLAATLTHNVALSAQTGSAFTLNGGSFNQSETGPNGFSYVHQTGYSGVLFNLEDDFLLEESGDFIEVSFEVVTLATTNNNPWSIRFGAFDNRNSPATANNEAAVTDTWTGYLAWYRTTSTNTNQTNNAIFLQGEGTAGLLGTPNQGGGFGGSPSGLGGGIVKSGANFNATFRSADTPFNVTFRVERTAAGVSVTTLQASDSGALVTREINAADAPTWNINAIAFAHNGDLRVENIEIFSNILFPTNTPPVAYDQTLQTSADTPLEITLTGSDADNDPLSFSVAAAPANGVLSGSPPNLTYTPSAGFSGADSFTFFAHDGQDSSEPATVSISVLSVGTPGGEGDISLGSAYVINGGSLSQQSTGGDGFAFTRTSGYQGALIRLEQTVNLLQPNDWIELEFDLVSMSTGNNDPWMMRFGLFDNGGLPVTGNNQTSITDSWKGYLAWFRTTQSTTDAANSGLFEQGAGSAGLAGVPNMGGGFGSNPSNLGGGLSRLGDPYSATFRTNDAPFTARIRLERTLAGIDVTTIRHSHTGEAISRAVAHPVTWTFNAIAIAHGGNFTVDNIVVRHGIADPNLPLAATDVVASPSSASSALVEWTDNAHNEDGYRIEIANTSSGPWSPAGTAAANATSFVVNGLTLGNTYHFRVIAFNAYGESVPSISASTTIAPRNIALNRPTKVDSVFSSRFPGMAAVDGNKTSTNSRWVSASTPMPHWIELDLGASYTIDQLKFWTGANGNYSHPLTDFALQQWDGQQWQDVFSVAGSNNTGVVSESFPETIVGSRVRLFVTGAAMDTLVRLYELEIRGMETALQVFASNPVQNGALSNPNAALTLAYSEPIQIANSAGIRILRLSDGVFVGSPQISTSGPTLTVSHNGLAYGEAYRLIVPQGAVVSSGNPAETHGHFSLDFTTVPVVPAVRHAPGAHPDVTAPYVVTFDRPVSLVNQAGITVTDLTHDQPVAIQQISVSGDQLSLVLGNGVVGANHLVRIAPGAVADALTSVPNGALSVAFHTDVLVLFREDFRGGLGSFATATSLGLTAGSSSHWKFDNTWAGPGSDFAFLSANFQHENDFAASPAVSLQEGQSYVLNLQHHGGSNNSEGGILNVYLSPGRDLEDLTFLGEVRGTFGGSANRKLPFVAPAGGEFYLIFTYGGTAYQGLDSDDITLRKVVDSVVDIVAPAPGSTWRESDTIPVEISAVGLTAPIQQVRLYDGERLVTTLAGEPYLYNWTYHLPGTRTLTAVAEDELGLTTSTSIEITVTFDDDTLPPFIHFTFDESPQGWIHEGAFHQSNAANGSGSSKGFRFGTSQDALLSSPVIFLRQGETYEVEFLSRVNDGTQTYNWRFGAFAAQGMPANPATAGQPWSITGLDWQKKSLTFTVPADGAYHLTFFSPANGVWEKIWIDEVRLIGNFNAAPSVELTPGKGFKSFAGGLARLVATATDEDGQIVQVDFLANGELISPGASRFAPPYAFDWADLPEGTWTVSARAYDNEGGFGDSAPITVEVLPNHFSIATPLGGAATDESFTAAAYLSDGTLVMGGVLDPYLLTSTPLFLHGATPGDRGIVARLTGDGTAVLSVSVVGPVVSDLSVDGSDRIFVAAAAKGALALNPTAQSVLWSDVYPNRFAHRVDAAPGGTFAVLSSTTPNYLAKALTNTIGHLYGPDFTPLATMAGARQHTADLAVDEATATVIFVGFKNLIIYDGWNRDEPVDIPSIVGRSFDGSEKYSAYDWGGLEAGTAFLNYYTSNMADTRATRCIIGPDGMLYVTMEFDGGNTPVRFSPFDLSVPVNLVGGNSPHHQMHNTSTVPKLFVGRYVPDTGDIEIGQWITPRNNNTSGHTDNTMQTMHGGLAVDAAGRIHVVGSSASGLPMTHDPNAGIYSGGAYHLVYSADFSEVEFLTRVARGNFNGIAIAPDGMIALAGRAERETFLHNAWQNGVYQTGAQDAYFAVGDLSRYFKFQNGVHPRLFFTADDLPGLRERIEREPYASMFAELLAQRDFGDFYRPTNSNNATSLAMRAYASAMLYVLTGDEDYALDARTDWEAAFALIGNEWASPAAFGLTSYDYATKLAIAYDFCASSDSWDAGFNFLVSSKLRSIADVIIQSGGSGQNADPGSNWQGIRGASGGLALLAMDHSYEPAMLNDAVNRVVNYINNNQKGASPRGWNPEGSGYTAYPLGSFVGPFALALRQSGHDVDLTANSRLQWMFWSLFAGATTALDIYGMGGVKTDWSDDNGHIGGEGSYGLAFAMAPEGTLGGIRHAYDRLMGDLSPLGARWDSTRHGTFWSILFYPEDVAPQDPAEIWSWHQASRDTAGLGMMTFRDGYEDANDSLVQFKARLNTLSAHDGADGLGFRVIAQGAPFVLGGGRDNPARDRSQPTVYPANPDTTAVNSNSNQGSFVGTPLIKPDGGGHAIAWMSTNNVGTNNHKRWIITDFDRAATGADVTVVVADTSSNGTHWQLPTFLGNTLTTSGNTFTITGGNGATLRGTILHPGGSPVITVGVRDRGSAYSLLNGGTLATEDPVTNPRILQNRYLHIAGADGNFLVVMTIQRNGAHPSVARLSGGVADALIQVGNRQYQLQSDNVLYDGAAFSPPAVTVTFDHGALGTHSDGTLVQTMAYGAMPVAPGISVTDPDYVFLGWDKPVGPAVVDTVYTAVYGSAGDPAAPVFTVDPVSMAVVEGSSVALSVVASGNPAPAFQWYKNGAMIPGATDAVLAINYAVLSDAGTYFATAGNSEGTATSASAVLTVNEAPANQSPTANSQVVLMESGQAVAIQLTATDPENDPLTFHIVEDPSHGVITGTAPNLTYTPNTGFSGIDVFTFRVHDGISFSNTAYVEIEVTEGGGGGSLLGAAYVINGGALDQSTTGPNGLAFNRASGYQGALFNLTETISLQSVGDYIELHLTVAEFVSSNNNPWSFRFGLFDHAGVPATADNQTTVTNEWVGYLAWFRTSMTGTSVVNNGLFRQASGSAGLAGTPNQGGGFGSNPSGIGGGIARLGSEFTGTFRTEDTSFQAMLRLERTEDGLHVTTIRHSHTGEEISRTDLAAHVPTWDFNAIAFAHDGNFTLVDIEVISFGEAGDEPPPDPLPEPIRINFERAASATPSGFLKDAGQVFGDRGNGYSYGWSGDRTGSARERNSANSPGGEFDTLNHMQMGGDFSWEIEVPNGEYSVRVVAGDPDHLDSTHRIAVQGVLTVDGQPSAGERWIEGTQTIVVTNGRIALSNAPGANNNKICFVEITALTSEPPTVAVTGVTLDPVLLSLETGATEQLTATVSPSDATDDTVTWSSSNPSVATVSSSGLVTAVGAGSATITVTTEDGGMTASASVDVFMPGLRVSFETATTATTPGFLKDAGHPFGNRDNGYAYGWSGDRTTTSRERNSSASASKAFDTLNHMQMGGAFHWEIALPDGTYSVRVVAGDAEFPDSTIRIAVQGLLTVSGQLSASQRWVEGTQIVEVTHGILTVSNATGASNNKISFIEITPVPPAAQSSLALDEGGIDEPFMARLSADRGGHSLSFPTTQGRSYWLEASTDLRNWSEIGGPWEGDGDEWVMDLPITSERRFFRIRSED